MLLSIASWRLYHEIVHGLVSYNGGLLLRKPTTAIQTSHNRGKCSKENENNLSLMKQYDKSSMMFVFKKMKKKNIYTQNTNLNDTKEKKMISNHSSAIQKYRNEA